MMTHESSGLHLHFQIQTLDKHFLKRKQKAKLYLMIDQKLFWFKVI